MSRSEHRAHGGAFLDLVALIVVTAFVVALLVPVVFRGRGHAWKVSCTGRLRQIYPAATDYAAGQYSFPLVEGTTSPRAHESLNLLLRSRFAGGLGPELFKCPAGEAELGDQLEGEPLTLSPATLDYAWTSVPAKPDKLGALASDKYLGGWNGHKGHPGVIIVLYTDGHVEEMDATDPEFDRDTGLPVGLAR
jgi:prepilin-type processing-associated H-X9-DG protein